MVNLKGIKNKITEAVSNLSPDKLAEIYFMDRKRYIKEAWYGDSRKAKEILRKNDQFYLDNHFKDTYLFHKSHQRFQDWLGDYHWFMHYQELMAGAKREHELRSNDLGVLQAILNLLEFYRESEDKKLLEELTDALKQSVDKKEKELSEYPMIIKEIESQIEENQYFREQDYFQDVDPLGFKDFSWEEFMDVKCNMASGKPRKIQ